MEILQDEEQRACRLGCHLQRRRHRVVQGETLRRFVHPGLPVRLTGDPRQGGAFLRDLAQGRRGGVVPRLTGEPEQ